MSRVTPFFCIAVSSSFWTSSNVKPYWKPEQPPPLTKTRSFRSGLPSSSISCLTLFAALSVKTSGAGISVGAFIGCSCESFRGLSAYPADGVNYQAPQERTRAPRLSTRGRKSRFAQGSIGRRELELDGLPLFLGRRALV